MGPILKQEREGRGLGSMLWQRRRKGDLRSMSGLKIKKKRKEKEMKRLGPMLRQGREEGND